MPLGDLSKEYARTFFVLKDNSDDRLWTTYREVIDFLTCVIELVHYSFYIQEYITIVSLSLLNITVILR